MSTWFHELSIDGRAAVLCLLEPDWATRPKITHSFETIETEGDTGIEARESQRRVMRLSVDYRYTFAPAEAEEFLAAIRDLQGARLALPLCVDRLPKTDYLEHRIYACQRWVNYDPATFAYEMVGLATYPETVGLIIGRLTERPRLSARTDLHGTVQIRLQHDAPWSCRIEPHALSMPAWALDPDWAVALPEDTTKTALRTRQLGLGGESSLIAPNSPAKRVQRAGFTLVGREEIRRVLTFWSECRGAHAPFTVPLSFRPGWNGTPGDEPNLQARFAQDDLMLEYRHQEAATTQIGFAQELLLDPGEPEQNLPDRARLYKLQWDGATAVKAYTDWEEPLVRDSVTYETAAIEHKAEAETLRPGSADWELLMEDFEGNPLRAFSLVSLERRLKLEIWECDPAAPEDAVLLFAGEIARAPSKGRFYTATAVLLGGVMKLDVPNFRCQQGCNYTLYDELCGVNPDTYKVTGTIAAIAAATIDITCGSAAAADWFASGVAIFNTGDDTELRYILRSEPIGGGQRVTLHRPLVTSVVTDAVELLPGCDSQYTGGCAKFANQGNFGGAPYKPAYIDQVVTGRTTKTGK
ncbi:MAG: phage BR0599 family protein [Verrucomicrobiota bacterium]